MLKQLGVIRTWIAPTSKSKQPNLTKHPNLPLRDINVFTKSHGLVKKGQVSSTSCSARRRAIRYEDDSEENEEYGYNEEIAMLELYSQSSRDEVLLVHALVDEQDVEVLIFKGFSSCLSYKTSPDPSKSVIPARAVIKTIDRIKGPFDPSNIEYIETDLPWEAFKNILASK